MKKLLLLFLCLLPSLAFGQRIADLPAATTPLSGADYVAIVQGSTTKKATVSEFSAAGGVQSVSGTSGRITVTDGAVDALVDIDAAYIGQTSINTVGTIQNGFWHGDPVPALYGGTGQTSYTDGQLLIGNSAGNGLSKAALTAGAGISITNGNGTISISSPDALTVGTTTIASGTTTRVLFDNAGVLGEYTISGTGNVCMSTSCVMTTPNIGSATGSITGNAGTATALANARTIGGVSFDGTANITVASATGGFTITGGSLTITDQNVVLSTGTGTKFGTATTQKLSFFNATPVVQQTGDAGTALVTLGLMSGTPTFAVGNISGLGTGVATWLATPSSANLISALTDETGTGPAVFATSPAITTPVITGITSGAAAAAGKVGELLTANATSGSVSLSNATPANVTSLSITAGQWLIIGSCDILAGGNSTQSECGLSDTSATFQGTSSGTLTQRVFGTVAGGRQVMTTGTVPINISGTTTYYLVGQSNFSTSTAAAGGTIFAVRIR